jgi:hypothetical protein
MAAQPKFAANAPAPGPAAIGWRAHSGWAQLIALGGPLAAPIVLARRRVELADRSMPASVQPFHAARDLGPEAGERLVARCREASLGLARQALRDTREELGQQDYRVAACGVLQSSARPLPAFAAVLASHALIHTAEGELFREVLAAAGAELGLAVVRVKEKEVLDRWAAGTGLTVAEAEGRLAELGRTLGPPWRQDEKLATLAAWLALAESGATRPA